MQGFPLPPIEPSVPHDPNIEHPLLPIMTSERILGALLWSVWHHQLSAELIRRLAPILRTNNNVYAEPPFLS